jgi:hypothetical protein
MPAGFAAAKIIKVQPAPHGPKVSVRYRPGNPEVSLAMPI